MLQDWFRFSIVAALALAFHAIGATASVAQQWPTRPVRFVLPFGPGSGADTGARLITEKLQQKWGQPVVIDGKPGGDGLLSLGAVVSAKDDHTFFFGPSSIFVVQRYVPEVRKGDKRIILVDGKAVGGINRVPAEGEARSNLHVGGRPEPLDLSPRDRAICEAIGPELKARGLIFAGIDVIGDYLTEINVTSPTGIQELKRFGGADGAAAIWDAIEAKAAK